MLQQTWEYTYLFEIFISFTLNIYPEVGWMDHIVVLLLTLWEIFILFSTVAVQIHMSTQQCTRVPFSPHPCQQLAIVTFLIIAIITDVRWCLIVVLLCISPLISDVTIFSCTCWPFACVVSKNVCLGPLPTLKLDQVFFLIPGYL